LFVNKLQILLKNAVFGAKSSKNAKTKTVLAGKVAKIFEWIFVFLSSKNQITIMSSHPLPEN
jgi:hypothetical protein